MTETTPWTAYTVEMGGDPNVIIVTCEVPMGAEGYEQWFLLRTDAHRQPAI